jgi:aryl-alcohol dehydrogenase-like predicted oxidoreductase
MFGNNRRHIIEQCEASLRRLQTDYIDLYQIHRPQPEVPIDEALRAFDDLVRSGKVRYVGTSNFEAWRVMETLWVSKELGLNRVVSEQPPYNLLDRRVERELVPLAQSYDVAIIPWSPLAGGILSGKYRKQDRLPQGSRFGDLGGADQLNDAALDAVEQLLPLADEKGCTLSQLALAWLMAQPAVTSPIIGPRTMEQLEDNLGALDTRITDHDRARIDAIIPPGRMVSPFYEADRRPHLHRW